jgi:uncharacterized protein (DUF736 family)
MDLDQEAEVELTSEDPEYPIEGALVEGGKGWRASNPGKQMIRINFDKPQNIRRIYLVFEEMQQEQTQEFLLKWSADGGKNYQEIVRQQYNFNPAQASREVEDYSVNLDKVTTLELNINPDITQKNVNASLSQFQIS